MKIAITGHSAGIGQAFAQYLSSRGHEIVGLSKRNGDNIRNVNKILEKIVGCDMWINNAQAGYAQTELLYKVWENWQDQNQKMIWIISTIMTSSPKIPLMSGQSFLTIAEYKNQKRALEDAFYQLRYENRGPRMLLIRPGVISTQPGQKPNHDGADVTTWVKTICDFYLEAIGNNLWIEEISLGFRKNSIVL